MSALVCGKRSAFEDRHTPPPISKRLRCSSPSATFSTRTPGSGSSSPVTGAPAIASGDINPFHCQSQSQNQGQGHSSDNNALISQLKRFFPEMDEQHLEAALESCGYDLASAIKSLNEMRIASTERDSPSCGNVRDSSIGSDLGQSIEANQAVGLSVDEPISNNHMEGAATAIPANGSDWVELILGEMQNASDMDDARIRASRVLEALEKAIVDRTGSAAENLQKENMLLKQQIEGLIRDNSILKRAVAIQHERQKEHEERGHEVQHLKQLLSQYQEQLRTLEVNNYALTMHLRQAQGSNSIPGRFHPDVF